MSERPKVLFLYTELAAYIVNCFEALAERGVDVHVVAFPVNIEAPFQFDFANANAHYYSRSDFSESTLGDLIEAKAFDAVVCSGWIDPVYLKLAKKYRRKIKQIVALDNSFRSDFRVRLSALRARFAFRSAFDAAWVPGAPQRNFALAMGFKSEEIFTGFYTANFEHLSKLKWEKKGDGFPKRFVFTGRYIDFKGIAELWEAFSSLKIQGWELHCAGTGPLFETRKQGPGIHHLGFVQPDEFDTFARQGGVFVLPSYKEPWGVVVHEFASAAYPIICSRAVGSASAFVREGVNGHLVNMKKGATELARIMALIATTDDEKLWEMGVASRELAAKVSISGWVDTAIELLKPKHA